MKKIYKAHSPIAGQGIFAGEDFKKGEFITFLRGRRLRWKYHHSSDNTKCANWFGVGRDLWIDPDFPLSHINHSCNPNTGLQGMVTLRALRPIRKGEELTFDYSSAEAEKEWTMRCHCGAPQCRKVIRSIQFLPKKTYQKYLPMIPRYFQKIYLAYTR